MENLRSLLCQFRQNWYHFLAGQERDAVELVGNCYGGIAVDLNFYSERDKLFVQVAGELDLLVSSDLRAHLDQALDAKGARHLFLDFSGVTFIDSSGLGVILGRYRRLAESGGTVTIKNAPPQIYKILELSGLNRIMQITQLITEESVTEG